MNATIAKPSCRTTLGFLLSLLGAATIGLPSAQAQESQRGLFVTVFNPITDALVTQIQNSVDRARSRDAKPLRVVVFDFNPGGNEAGTDNYGSSLVLARYIKNLSDNGVTTVAFLRNTTTRHTVLPVLACKDIVMAQDARLGEVAKGNDVVPVEDAQQYAKYAGRGREAAVMKMLYPEVEIVQGNLGGQPFYLDAAKIGKPGFEDVVVNKANMKIIKAKGLTGLYNAVEASQFQLCQLSGMQTPQDVLNAYQLDPSALTDSDFGDEPIKACKIELIGLINEDMKQKLLNQFKEVRSKKENTIFLILDCGGGVAKVAREIADELHELKGDNKKPIRTIAFIPNKAPDLATFIAFGCSEIIMYKGAERESEATIGDFSQFLGSMASTKEPSNTIQFIKENLREVADKRGYPKLIVDAMLEKDMTLLQVKPKQGTNLEMMTPAQLNAADPKNFGPPRTLKQPGTLLKLDSTLAKELRIAQDTVNNRDVKEVYARYGLTEKDVRDSRPGWLDNFAAFLRRTEISILLIIIGFAGLILEVKMPGATIPGLVALICFVLFFWAHAYSNGQTIWLAVALFVLGLILLGIEIFILPGFGVTGISGVLLILAGVALATLETAPSMSDSDSWGLFAGRLLRYGLTLVASGVLAMIFARYLPKIPYANRMILMPPTENTDAESELSNLPGAEQAAALLGQVGVATSMLRPAGMAKVGDAYVDVVTEGDFIEPGTPIQVVEVEGTRIVVKKV